MLIVINKDNIPSDEFIEQSIAEYAKIFGKHFSNFTIQRPLNSKPTISPKEICFNISHSGAYTIIAISEEEVGIDIQVHKNIDYHTVAKRFFHKNEQPHSIKEFYDLWTAKEALIKNNKLSFLDGMRTNISTLDINVLDIIDNYSVAVMSKDKEYLFKFNF